MILHEYRYMPSSKSYLAGNSVNYSLPQQKRLGSCEMALYSYIKRVHTHWPLLFMVSQHVDVLCYRAVWLP